MTQTQINFGKDVEKQIYSILNCYNGDINNTDLYNEAKKQIAKYGNHTREEILNMITSRWESNTNMYNMFKDRNYRKNAIEWATNGAWIWIANELKIF